MKIKYKLIILLTALSFSISCTGIPTTPKLKLPPQLVYESITAEEVKCLSDDTFLKIYKRDKLKSARIQTLRAIIEATH